MYLRVYLRVYNIRGRSWTVSQSQSSPFNVVLIQFIDNCNFITIEYSFCTFHSYFLRLVVSHDLLSTDEWFFLFPSILVAQVLVGTMGPPPSIWVQGVGDISVDVILSCDPETIVVYYESRK